MPIIPAAVLGLVGALAVAAAPPPAPDLSPLAPLPDLSETLAIGIDRNDRMTVPVSIGGDGPHRFVIDTGAERTVISAQLARQLGLSAGKTVRMSSITEVTNVRTVVIPSLELSRATVKGIHAPALDRAHLGAAGMLGIDSLQTQRVLLDFKKGTMTVGPATARIEITDPNTIVVRGKSRFGQLVLVDARAAGQRVRVIIDTGAQISIGNLALQRKLLGKRKITTQPVEIVSVTGGMLMADYAPIPEIKLGGLTFENLPIAFVDAEPFRKFGMGDEPALLLGMDALRLFDRVSVDFANKQVRFLPPDGAQRRSDVWLAERSRTGEGLTAAEGLAIAMK